ncbi:uncharacterized protein L201_002352 [Kwoniella dendrophila CBS 6074]|uniref:F-box domain-containing protein n=1 Tax=Kwoniella dendrophila CBS 6074 TaxID=1295534 RepID=A0AAX4JSN9_9TREE
MPSELAEDVILLIAQKLQSLNYHKTLSNLSVTSKNTYQLTNHLVYRHVILTDHSLPLLFGRITSIPQEDRHIFFESVDEEAEDDILKEDVHPVTRLRVQLGQIYKLTIDTDYEDCDYESLSSIAKCLDFFMGEILLPRVSRLVFTSKHGTAHRVGLLSNDQLPYLLRTFLPLACQPKFICCSFSPETPACPGDFLTPTFTLNRDGHSKEIVNIHQARRILPPRFTTSTRISFGEVSCLFGDDVCRSPNHPKSCIEVEKAIRIEELASTIASDIGRDLKIQSTTTSKTDLKEINNTLTIIERTIDDESSSYCQLMEESQNRPDSLSIPPNLMHMLNQLPVPTGPIMSFGIGGTPPANANLPAGLNGNIPPIVNANNGNAPTTNNAPGSANGTTNSSNGDTNGTHQAGINSPSLNPGIFVPPSFTSTFTFNNGTNGHNSINNNNTGNVNGPMNSTTTNPASNANQTPPSNAVGTPMNGPGISLSTFAAALGSFLQPQHAVPVGNFNNTNNTSPNGNLHNSANSSAQSTATAPSPSNVASQSEQAQRYMELVFVGPVDAVKQPVCEACGEII